MNRKKYFLVHVLVLFFIIHFIEEYGTRFYETDHTTASISALIGLSPLVTFALIELALFTFLALILISILQKQNRLLNFLSIILSIISIYEFTHVCDSLKSFSYSPGLFSGAVIGACGLVLAYGCIKNGNKKPFN